MATFGKLTDGASSSSWTIDRLVLSTATPTATGTVTKATARLWIDTTGSCRVKAVIYADNAGTPAGGALLAISDEVIITGTSEAAVEFSFSGGNSIVVISGRPYWIGYINEDPGAINLVQSRANSATLQKRDSTFSYASPANPCEAVTDASGEIDCFITFTEGLFPPSAIGNPFHPGRGVLNMARFNPSQEQASSIGVSYSQVLNDTIVLTDTVSKSLVRTLTDTIGNAEVIAKALTRTLTDTIGNSEVFSTLKTQFRTLTDTIGLTDSIAKNPQKVLSDTLPLGESIAKYLQRTLSDTATLVSDVSSSIAQFLTLTDTIAFVDSIAKLLSRTLTDTASFVETRITSITKTLSDTIGLTDTIAKAVTYARTLTDSLGLTDSVSRATTRTLTDTFSFSETIGTVKQYLRTLSDTIGLTDTISSTKTYVRTLTDQISLTENFTILFNSITGGIQKLLNNELLRSIGGLFPGGIFHQVDQGAGGAVEVNKPSGGEVSAVTKPTGIIGTGDKPEAV